jgi:hypothetical protein
VRRSKQKNAAAACAVFPTLAHVCACCRCISSPRAASSSKNKKRTRPGDKIHSEGKEEEGKVRLPGRNRRLEGMDAGKVSDALPWSPL